MTTIWQPAAQETDPLTSAVVEAIRTQIFAIAAVGHVIEAMPGGWRETQLVDGRFVRFALSVAPGEQSRWGVRACATMRVTGEVALADQGYRVASEVVVDLATRAILSCECRLESVGQVQPAS